METTNIAKAIPEAQIPGYIQNLHRPPTLGESLAWAEDGTLGHTYRFNTWTTFAVPTAPRVEGAAFEQVTMSLSNTPAEATPANVGLYDILTVEAMKKAKLSGIGLEEEVIHEFFAALEDRKDADIFAVSTGATNTVGLESDVMDEDKFFAGLAAFVDLENPAPNGIAMVLKSKPAEQLRKLLNITAASSRVGDSAGKGALESAYLGYVGGVHVWRSSNVAAQGTGSSNVIIAPGKRSSGLGLVNAEGIDGSVVEGREGKLKRNAQLVMHNSYGCCITRQDKIVELVSN